MLLLLFTETTLKYNLYLFFLCFFLYISLCKSRRSLFTLGEEEASSLPNTAATGLGPTGWVFSLSAPGLGLGAGGLRPRPGLGPGGWGARLFWLLPTSGEGPPAGVLAGLEVFGSKKGLDLSMEGKRRGKKKQRRRKRETKIFMLEFKNKEWLKKMSFYIIQSFNVYC